MDFLRDRADGPVEVLAACGHGRSFGEWSRFLFARRLPGIEACGLWQALAGRPSLPTLALITDVGNDLAYGEPIERIAGWVATCLDRLSRRQAVTVLTLLPLARLEKLSPAQYYAARSILFPGRNVPWPVLLDRAQRLDRVLRRLGGDWKAHLIEPEEAWYGLDPIHIRTGRRVAAWERIVAPWGAPAIVPGGGHLGDTRRRWRVPAVGAEEYQILGRARQTPQPAVRFDDGSTLELY